tara:strand:- start:11097 stop:11822 length:726 start_codon:yes stop_codon:yes gene_type:complete
MIYKAQDVLLDSAKRILVDSNIIVAYFDEKHKFHKEVFDRLNPVYLNGASFFYVQPCLLEFKEYWRRKKLTECIEEMIGKEFYFFREFRKLYNKFRTDNQNQGYEYLSDRQIKNLRGTLENIHNNKGLNFWFDLSNVALTGTLSNLENRLSKSKFIYAKFDDNNLFPISNKPNWPKWIDADLAQEKFCLAANDAAILNMTNNAFNIDSFISNDGDMLFAVSNGALKHQINTYTFLDNSNFI